jgi:hypothetical protein
VARGDDRTWLSPPLTRPGHWAADRVDRAGGA